MEMLFVGVLVGFILGVICSCISLIYLMKSFSEYQTTQQKSEYDDYDDVDYDYDDADWWKSGKPNPYA